MQNDIGLPGVSRGVGQRELAAVSALSYIVCCHRFHLVDESSSKSYRKKAGVARRAKANIDLSHDNCCKGSCGSWPQPPWVQEVSQAGWRL